MINVGDKFIIDGVSEVVKEVGKNIIVTERCLGYTYEEVYRSMHQQEKERADKAEERIEEVTDFWMNVSEQYKQRWETLNKKIKERHEYLENMAIECMDNIDEAVKWNAAKHEVLMIMKDMYDLEEVQE